LKLESHIGTYQLLIMAAAAAFLILPLLTTFNELLTAVAVRLGLSPYIRDWAVPVVGRMAAATLQYGFGVQAYVTDSGLLLDAWGRSVNVVLQWNCLGWQTLILLIATLAVGLQGNHTLGSKMKCIIIGVEGTILFNVGRIVLVLLIALTLGELPAIIFHDYGGTILTLCWLAAFWYLSQEHILKPSAEAASGSELFSLEEIGAGC